jgi:hypothetical protein
MIEKKELLNLLTKSNIAFVIIGGIAMRFYRSPRVTQDLDLAIRAVDIDEIVELMYQNSFRIITAVSDDNLTIINRKETALDWIEVEKPGTFSMIFTEQKNKTELSFGEIDVNSQTDFLYELPVPFMKLMEQSHAFTYNEVELRVASPEDLLYLKKKRPDSTSSDKYDIDYIKSYLKENKQHG